MEADYELIDNEERHQYEFHVDKYTPKIEYIKSTNGEIYLTHTEVPTQLGGKGIGSQLVEKALKDIEFIGTRGMAGTKICELDLGERTVRIGIVSGLGNAEELIKKIESGEEHFDFVEVMACPGGCVAGAGQPFARSTEKRLRAEGLYKNDKALQIKRSENNPIVKNLYDDLLKNREHELLHVHYPGHKADA